MLLHDQAIRGREQRVVEDEVSNYQGIGRTVEHEAAVVVLKNNAFHAVDDDGNIMFDGTGSPLIAGDFVFNYALFPAPYRLVVQ